MLILYHISFKILGFIGGKEMFFDIYYVKDTCSCLHIYQYIHCTVWEKTFPWGKIFTIFVVTLVRRIYLLSENFLCLMVHFPYSGNRENFFPRRSKPRKFAIANVSSDTVHGIIFYIFMEYIYINFFLLFIYLELHKVTAVLW